MGLSMKLLTRMVMSDRKKEVNTTKSKKITDFLFNMYNYNLRNINQN